jgi:hypothetical protein
MTFISQTKTLIIMGESAAAERIGKVFPVKLLYLTLRHYPGLAVIAGAFGLACGYIGHIL